MGTKATEKRKGGSFRCMKTGEQFYFCLYASNGRCLVTSEMYNRERAMMGGIKAVARLAGDAKLD